MPQLHLEPSEQKIRFVNPNVVHHEDGDLEYRSCTNMGTVILHNWYEVLAVRIFLKWNTCYQSYAAWQGKDKFEAQRREECKEEMNRCHERMERLKKRYPTLNTLPYRTFDL